MNIGYKAKLKIGKISKTRFVRNVPKEPEEKKELYYEEMPYSYEQFVELEGPRIVDSIINAHCIESDMENLMKCICYPEFTFDISFFQNPFIDGLLLILKSAEPGLCKQTLHFIQYMWYLHPENFTPPELIDAVFCCFNYVEMNIRKRALHALFNYASISPECQYYLIRQHDIFDYLRKYLLSCTYHKEYSPGYKMLFLLINDRTEEFHYQIQQFIPILKFTLMNSSTIVRRMTLWSLAPILESPRLFQYCSHFEIHNELSQICTSVIDPEYAYYYYRCVFAYVHDGYTFIFSQRTFLNCFRPILAKKLTDNISPVFYTIACLIPRNWEYIVVQQNLDELFIEYALNSSTDNKISASLCISQLIIYSHPQLKDQIALNGGLESICDLFECFSEEELISALRALYELLELNLVQYQEKLLSEQMGERIYSIEAVNGSALEKLKSAVLEKLSTEIEELDEKSDF